jgi:flavodoxin
MKAIVVYYSLTGKTRSIAEGFAKEFGCDIKRIEEVKKRSLPGAYFLGAFAAMRGKTSEIAPLNIDLEAYDTIVIATPVWASSPVPAVNTFMTVTNFKNKKVVFLISPASGNDSKAASLMTDKIHAKGGAVLQHHALKTSGAKEEDLSRQAAEIAKLYK